MESLLSLSFDNISSKDAARIRKGLRQIEGLVAQICLSKTPPSKRQASATAPHNSTPKGLASLSDDLAFREFFRLQESFEWNVVTRLIEALERLLGMRSNPANDQLIISALDLVHGLLLLHPASRSLFAREIYMNLLLDLLEPTNLPAIHLSTISVLTAALLAQPRNNRAFEACNGLQTVTSLSKSRIATTANPQLQSQINDFLHFYLLPEAASGSVPEQSQSPSKDAARSASSSSTASTKSTSEKAKMLAPYMAGGGNSGGARAAAEVDGMLQRLRTGQALGVSVAV